MAQGPPPSDAGPSQSHSGAEASSPPVAAQSFQYFAAAYSSEPSPFVTSGAGPLPSPQYNTSAFSNPGHPAPIPPVDTPSQPYAFHHYSPGGASTWRSDQIPYGGYHDQQPPTPGSAPQYAGSQGQQPHPYSPSVYASVATPPMRYGEPSAATLASGPQVPAPPPYRKHWDNAIKSFLRSVGLTQALRGFESDMLVINKDWEEQRVPPALAQLVQDISSLSDTPDESIETTDRALDDRKLDNVHFSSSVVPRTPTTITKSISQFLTENRARNDASNRAEFLESLAEKRRKLTESGLYDSTSELASCARTDAKTQNRDLQMKYDIAKNEDGPLRKTVKMQNALPERADTSPAKMIASDRPDIPTSERYSALDERLQNVEKHVAVRYVPSAPRSLLDRLKFLEEHLIQLEREYPPWAALHFNQPRRGWPPPPRPTPIIVPTHLTWPRTSLLYNNPPEEAVASVGSSDGAANASQPSEGNATPKHLRGTRPNQSSLHRAVMERLEVQKAMNDLAGVPDDSKLS